MKSNHAEALETVAAGKPICEMANLPTFETLPELNSHRMSNRSRWSFFLARIWRCRFCGGWHYMEEA